MKIKYAGPKVFFTRYGIDFDNNKDDKYVYINIAIQLLKAFTHDYKPGEKYVYDISSKRLSDEEIMKFVIDVFPEHKLLVEKSKEDANVYFANEVQKAKHQRDGMSEIEYESWIKNIQLMKKYVIQRQFNKSIYYHIVEKIVVILKTHAISQIHAPMFKNFVHVLHSIQGVLKRKPDAKTSNLDIYEDNGNLMTSLIID